MIIRDFALNEVGRVEYRLYFGKCAVYQLASFCRIPEDALFVFVA